MVGRIVTYFDIALANVHVNWYPNGNHFRPPHHDAYRNNPSLGENMTVIASFGATRVLTFQHRTGMSRHFPLENGTILYFGEEVNRHWKHGIDALGAANYSECRISISMWGVSRLQI